MYLSLPETILLSTVTLAAGLFSFALHYYLIRPIERALHQITEQSKKIAEGDFETQVPAIGPLEFRMLAKQFNDMSIKLDKSFHQLRTAESSRKELVANVSHDLRTPLASIQSFVEALQDDVIRDQETFHRYLSTIRLETTRLSHLINDLFELSRLEAGAETFHPSPHFLDNLLIEELQACSLSLDAKKLRVQVSLPDQLPPVWVSAEQIKRLIANLLQNAVRYSPFGGTISIRAEASSPDYITVTITDTGEGIAKDEQSRIFERFYRTDKSRNRERGGAGLGLAIVKSIVERHDGQVGVRSEPGKGSSFWFTLPIFSPP